jgi:hypothetical protein
VFLIVSYCVEILTSGVPDCEYQCLNCVKSNPLAYTVTVTQQSKHFFPLSFALLDDAGNELEKGVLTIKDNAQSFVFENIKSALSCLWCF